MANAAQLGPGNFQSAVGRLAPMGLVWPSKGGGVFQGFWNAVAGTLAAFHAREGILTEIEAFPPTSVELLPDWEEVLGLPDPCLGSNPVTAARQAAVRARLAASGGQSVPYYIGVAADLGATIAITEYRQRHGDGGVDAYWSAWRNASWAYRLAGHADQRGVIQLPVGDLVLLGAVVADRERSGPVRTPAPRASAHASRFHALTRLCQGQPTHAAQ